MWHLMRGIVVLALSSAWFPVATANKQAANANNSHTEKGIAAFYGRNMDGHKTARGTTYVASEPTTAHRTLPCGTKVRITNTKMAKAWKRPSMTEDRHRESESWTFHEL